MYRCWDGQCGSHVLDVAGFTGVGRRAVTSWMWLGVWVLRQGQQRLGCGWVYRFWDERCVSDVLDVAGCTGVRTSGVEVTSWMWLDVYVLGRGQ